MWIIDDSIARCCTQLKCAVSLNVSAWHVTAEAQTESSRQTDVDLGMYAHKVSKHRKDKIGDASEGEMNDSTSVSENEINGDGDAFAADVIEE